MNYKEYYQNQIPDGGKVDYHQYYTNQLKGAGLPVFTGYPNQRGHGIGGFFRRLSNWIMPIFKSHGIPLLKKGGEAVATELLKSVTNIATDTLTGKNIKKSAKENLSNSLNNLSKSAQENLSRFSKQLDEEKQNGKGYKRRYKLKNNHQPKKFKFRRLIDVFDNA